MTFIQTAPRLPDPYANDRLLQSYLRRNLPGEVLVTIDPSLQRVAAAAAGSLLELAALYRDEEPVHVPFDPWGNRIDEVRVNRAWETYAQFSVQEGLVATAYERAHGRYSRVHQFAMVYLADRSMQLYTCPLAMTDGCARTLELLAPPALRDAVLPRLVGRDPARAWISGQWMTERSGGSDVGLSETVARCENGQWRLYGHKWFTSAVTADVALTLARPEGNPVGGKGLGIFLVRVRDANGRLQNITVDRLKDKLGTRHLPTAELTLAGTPAEPVAGLRDGVRNMRYMLNLTRTWNSVCALAAMARALAWARAYAGQRVAFGAALSDKPLHLETLADMAAELEGAFHLTFFLVSLLGREETEDLSDRDAALLRTLLPVAKLLTAKQAVAVVSEGVECFGGAGYVEDTGIPELIRDAHVLPIWEGTTNVLALEAYRAIERQDSLTALVEMARRLAASATDDGLRPLASEAVTAMERAARWFGENSGAGARFEAGARRFALTVGRALSLALLVDHAQWALTHEYDRHPLVAAQRYAARGVEQIERPAQDLAAVRALALG